MRKGPQQMPWAFLFQSMRQAGANSVPSPMESLHSVVLAGCGDTGEPRLSTPLSQLLCWRLFSTFHPRHCFFSIIPEVPPQGHTLGRFFERLFQWRGLPASPLVSASGGKSLILFRRGMYAAEHSSYKAKFRRPAKGGPPEPERSRTPSVRMPNGCPDGAPLTQNADFGRDLTG